MECEFGEARRENSRFIKILQQFQKTFLIVKTNLKIWNEAIEGCQGPLNSVKNLSEQHRCCAQAQGLEEIIKKFPDLKEKLLYKIDREIDSHVTQLYAALEICKDLCEKIVKQNERCQTLYNKSDDNIELLTHRSPTCPSIVEMLEWLQDTESLMMKQYSIRKHLVDKISTAARKEESSLYKQWSEEGRELQETVGGEGLSALLGILSGNEDNSLSSDTHNPFQSGAMSVLREDNASSKYLVDSAGV